MKLKCDLSHSPSIFLISLSRDGTEEKGMTRIQVEPCSNLACGLAFLIRFIVDFLSLDKFGDSDSK
jgi:hypothetical protein